MHILENEVCVSRAIECCYVWALRNAVLLTHCLQPDVDIAELRVQTYTSMPASYMQTTFTVLILISITNFGFRFLEF